MEDCNLFYSGMSSFTEALERKAYEQKIPYKGVFELTPRCNFNCKMCYIHMDGDQMGQLGRELTNEEWIEIAGQARDAGMLHLNLTGGEIFVRPHFRELYEELSEMGFLIQIQSNGYLIDEKVMEWLAKRPPYAMRFTLYGTTNEVYEAVCGVKDGFDRVDHAIDLVLEAGIPFYLVSMVINENKDNLQEMYEYARRKGIPFQHSTTVINPGKGVERDVSKCQIPIEEMYVEPQEKIKRLYGHHGSALEMCGSYRKGFWLTWNGKMQLCTFLREPAVSVEGKSFGQMWEELLEKLEGLKMPGECENCKYEGFCLKCPGSLAAQCGAADKVNAAFCSSAKYLYEICYDENA